MLRHFSTITIAGKTLTPTQFTPPDQYLDLIFCKTANPCQRKNALESACGYVSLKNKAAPL